MNRILTVAIFGRIPNHSQVDLGWSVNELYPQAEPVRAYSTFNHQYEVIIWYQVYITAILQKT